MNAINTLKEAASPLLTTQAMPSGSGVCRATIRGRPSGQGLRAGQGLPRRTARHTEHHLQPRSRELKLQDRSLHGSRGWTRQPQTGDRPTYRLSPVGRSAGRQRLPTAPADNWLPTIRRGFTSDLHRTHPHHRRTRRSDRRLRRPVPLTRLLPAGNLRGNRRRRALPAIRVPQHLRVPGQGMAPPMLDIRLSPPTPTSARPSRDASKASSPSVTHGQRQMSAPPRRGRWALLPSCMKEMDPTAHFGC